MKTFLVGGAVRDKLLSVPSKDQDWVVVGATPQEMLDKGFKQVGADFPVFLCPETKDEFALARTERKSGKGHTAFVVDASAAVTLEEDLMRRDLTVNAMAMTTDGTLVDPFGGQADLRDGVLRHVSPAFAEDPLRVLRTARFAARFPSFVVHADTVALMSALVVAGEMETLTPERVFQELAKALDESKPSRFFEVLRDCGALAVLFPELEALAGVPQPAEHHPEVDTFVHVMLSLDQAAAAGAAQDVRFAVLLHDLGKGLTPKDMLPSHHKHEAAGVPLVDAVCDRLKAPKGHRVLARLVCEHHLRCHKVLDSRAGKVLKLLLALDGLRKPEMVDKFAQACEADARGRTGLEARPYPQADRLRNALVVVKSVSAKPLVERGFTGLKLAVVLQQARARALNDFLQSSTV